MIGNTGPKRFPALAPLKDYQDAKQLTAEIHTELSKRKLGNQAGQVWAFRLAMQPRDWVIVPYKRSMVKNESRKAATRATTARAAGVARGAEDVDFDDTRPLSPKIAAAWSRAKRGRGRPRVGEGAEKVLISTEKRLLIVTDALAKRKGLDRSKLIARAIREMLEREAGAEKRAISAEVSS